MQGQVERVAEAVLRVDVFAVALFHVQEFRHHQVRREGNRAQRCRGRDGTVINHVAQAHAACGVTEVAPLAPVRGDAEVAGTVAGGQPPQVLAVAGPARGIGDRVVALRAHGQARVLEVVRIVAAHEIVADAAEVDPRGAVLVAEQRPEGQKGFAVERAPVARVGARPGLPRRGLQRMAGRAQRQDVEQVGLVVALPVVRDELAAGRPAHADQRRARLHPRPVDAPVQRVGQRADLLFLRRVTVVVALREQHAAEQQGGVDAGQLHAPPVAQAGLHVEEVVVETAVAGGVVLAGVLRRVGEEAQRDQGAMDRLLATDPAPFRADAVRGQAETHRRDAGERLPRPVVRCQPVDRIGGVPQELEGAVFQLVQLRLLVGREGGEGQRRVARGLGGDVLRCGWCPCTQAGERECQQQWGEEGAEAQKTHRAEYPWRRMKDVVLVLMVQTRVTQLQRCSSDR